MNTNYSWTRPQLCDDLSQKTNLLCLLRCALDTWNVINWHKTIQEMGSKRFNKDIRIQRISKLFKKILKMSSYRWNRQPLLLLPHCLDNNSIMKSWNSNDNKKRRPFSWDRTACKLTLLRVSHHCCPHTLCGALCSCYIRTIILLYSYVFVFL